MEDVYVRGVLKATRDKIGRRQLIFKVNGVALHDRRFDKLHMTSHLRGVSNNDTLIIEPDKSRLKEYFVLKDGKLFAQIKKSFNKHGWWKLIKI